MQEPENKASINSKYAVSIGYHLKAQKWSKAAFSRRLGKSPAYIYLILNGKVSPSIAVFERTLEILDLTPSKFYRVREPETELAEKEMAMMRKMAEDMKKVADTFIDSWTSYVKENYRTMGFSDPKELLDP